MQRALFLCLVLLSFILLSCVPVPLPTRVRGASGSVKSPDYSFVKEGQTTKDEIIRQLGWANTGIRQERLFWGRWISSGRWGYFGGGPQIGIISKVSWSAHNLLVEFDEHNIVVRAREVDDSRLTDEILTWWKRSGTPPLDFSPPRTMSVKRINSLGTPPPDSPNATLVLNNDSIEVRTGPDTLRREREKITFMQPAWDAGDPEAEFLKETLVFNEDLPSRPRPPLRISFRVDPSSALILMMYVEKAASSPSNFLQPPALISPADRAVLDANPRTTTLRWNPTPGAVSYVVEWDYAENGEWHARTANIPRTSVSVQGTEYTFDFVGAQPGCWRVFPVNEFGNRGEPSEWRIFFYRR